MRITIRLIITALLFLSIHTIQAQHSKHPSKSQAESKRYQVSELKAPKLLKQPTTNRSPVATAKYKTLAPLQIPVLDKPVLSIQRDPVSNLPIFIKGNIGNLEKGSTLEERSISYLEALKDDLQIQTPKEEFKITRIEQDELGYTHLRLQQYYKNIPVYASEITLHERNNNIRSFMGRYYPTPSLTELNPSISQAKALKDARNDLSQYTKVITLSDDAKKYIGETIEELVIYHVDKTANTATLAWHFTIYPNVQERWEYFINAHNGEILNAYKSSCQLMGCLHQHKQDEHRTCSHQEEVAPKPTTPSPKPTTNARQDGSVQANQASDLFGINRNVFVYQSGNEYYMFDSSRDIFSASQSNLPDEPVGVIWTIDANNTSPANNNFNVSHVTSNNNNWNNPIAVSAHYNGGLAFDYFKNTFGRSSINGQGGNIVSLINVSDDDGSSMDNAFWNGAAMFYGNGGQAFDPLAKALDVAGHEMSHGVVQSTANLEYQGQSGALNESFADIFGAMIDRNDWQMGEDVVNNSFFPSGALRDLSDPHNGGNSLNDPGWQPRTMSEYQNLPNTPQGDNGGVHINSGIPNYAFYLTATSIGKNNAEDIYYRALSQYLTKSSQFTDLRVAATQSAIDLFGAASNEVAAVENAFNSVGIAGGSMNDYEEDVNINPGNDFIILSDASLSKLYLSNTEGSDIQEISDSPPMSKPSITDDGSIVAFIANDKKMHVIEIDWATGGVEEYLLQDQPIWRNVAISKDGGRIAALTDENDNSLYIYDFGLEEWNIYSLYNPTFSQGVSTGDVRYADALEWDFSGEYVMYDAFNELSSNFGENIDYWDIGFIQVWANSYNGWASGNVEKLFSGLPENTSVGNPTFAKNSPYIVAFDFITPDNGIQLTAANIESGAVSETPIFVQNLLHYPNYSIGDDKMIFDANDQNGNQVLARIDIQSNKMEAVANTAVALINDGKWGIWFAEGERELVGTTESALQTLAIKAYPNPFVNKFSLEANFESATDFTLALTDITGKQIYTKNLSAKQGKYVQEIALPSLVAGTYFIKIKTAKQLLVQKIVKF